MSLVVPFVFYQTEKPWKWGKEFVSQLDLPEELKLPEFLNKFPNFEIELFDLSYSDFDLSNFSAILEASLDLMKFIRSALLLEQLEDILLLSEEIEDPAKKLAFRKKLYYYLMKGSRISSKEILQSFKQGKLKNYRREAMTAAEELEQKGMERGKKQTNLETAKRMLERELDLQLILDITGLSEEELKKEGILSDQRR